MNWIIKLSFRQLFVNIVFKPITTFELVCIRNKELSRSFRVNKRLIYFGLKSIALDKNTKITKMEKRKLIIAVEVLHEVSVTYPETREYIDEKLEHKCSK